MEATPPETDPRPETDGMMPDEVPPDWNFYEELTDEEIELLTAAINQPVRF